MFGDQLGLLAGLMLGFDKPRNPILGGVLAGEVELAGKVVRRFKVGDQALCLYHQIRLVGPRFGTYAEYMCLPDDGILALKPSNVSYEEAAAIAYGGILALHFLKRAIFRADKRFLFMGLPVRLVLLPYS